MPDREAIRSNAKYLRNVRPIDPDEVSEYVEGQPHPAVVRQVLREEAYALGLRERDDGTFVPADDAPVPPLDLPVTAFPERYARRLEDLLVETWGPDWNRGDSGEALRERVRELKTAYHRGWDVAYDDETAALAYACYHLPDYYAAIQYVLAELAECELLPQRLRILDVGAGVGGPALGILDALPEDAVVRYEAVEPGAGADVLEPMVEAAGGSGVELVHHDTTAEAFEPEPAPGADGEPAFDLVLFGNVLSELDDPVGTARRYAEFVAEDGSLVLLSPADRETCRTLRAVERALADGDAAEPPPSSPIDLPAPGGDGDAATEAPSTGGQRDMTVFSPTVRLWPHRAPADEGWSFAVQPDLEVPGFQRALDEPAGAEGEFVNVDVQYAYAILRPDGERRLEYAPDRSRRAPLAESERAVSERVDCVAVKLSGDLAEGDRPLVRIGDGSQLVDHFAVLTKETSLNRGLREAAYGDLLTIQAGLVLWNDDEGAYNVVIDDETVVDVAPAPIR